MEIALKKPNRAELHVVLHTVDPWEARLMSGEIVWSLMVSKLTFSAGCSRVQGWSSVLWRSSAWNHRFLSPTWKAASPFSTQLLFTKPVEISYAWGFQHSWDIHLRTEMWGLVAETHTGTTKSPQTIQPSIQPTNQPSIHPTKNPFNQPTGHPSNQTSSQSSQPSNQSTSHPTKQPSNHPSNYPSNQPSNQPTIQPTIQPIN